MTTADVPLANCGLHIARTSAPTSVAPRQRPRYLPLATVDNQQASRCGPQMFDRERRQLIGRREAENLTVERQFGLQRTNDVLGFAKAMALAGVQEVRQRHAART